jgi:hypothetical protein
LFQVTRSRLRDTTYFGRERMPRTSSPLTSQRRAPYGDGLSCRFETWLSRPQR